MLNPAVPVIGSKVAVVGSKVTEMLKRKLQQRLMAEKAKKVKASSSDDEKDPALPSGSYAEPITNATTRYLDNRAFATGTGGSITTTVSCNSSFESINSFINHIKCSPQNGQNQNEFPKSVTANKNRIMKPKSSKWKKTQKATAVRCSGTKDSISTEISSNNVVSCNFNAEIEDIRRNCAAIMFGGAEVKHQQLDTRNSTFANGCYQLNSDLCKPSVTVRGEEGNVTSVSGARNGNSGLLGGVQRDSMKPDCSDGQNPMDDSVLESFTLSTVDADTGILKEAAKSDEGHVFHKFHNIDVGYKRPLNSNGVNSGLIESSLWPLLYGENSKQLNDYIHRIYCRDCQKSQERFPVGETMKSEICQPESGINPCSEATKCCLQYHKDVRESVTYYPAKLHMERERAAEVKQSNGIQSSQEAQPLAVQPNYQKTPTVFQVESVQDENILQLHSCPENVNDSNSDSTENSPSTASTPDGSIEKDSDHTMAKTLTTGIAGSQSAPVSDNRLSKTRKLSLKSTPKPSNKVIKFHEYKGPPQVSRPPCTVTLSPPPAVRSPPLKDDLFQKLQQRQLCLQMQLQLEFHNHQLMANLAGRLPSSCERRSISQLHLNEPKGSLNIVDPDGKETAGQPALANVSFSPIRTPMLLQSASGLMANPFTFVSRVNEMSQSLASVSMTLSLPVTTGNQCVTSSLMSTCETPRALVASSAVWRDDQLWNTRLVQSNMSKFPAVNEPVRTCASQVIISSTSCTSSLQTFCETNVMQSTTIAVASAMTSAPILCTGGKLFPDSISSVLSNAPKSKNSIAGSSGSVVNRIAAIVIPSRLEDVRVADLKAECRKRKLVVSGPKPNLIERLRPYEEDVLKCLSVNMRAATQDSECASMEKSQSDVGADQTSSPSSLTSMDSVVNMPPLCPLHEEESNGGDSSTPTAVLKSVHFARSNEMNYTAPDACKVDSHSSFQVPANFGLGSAAIVSASDVKSCFSHSFPVPLTVNTVARDAFVTPYSGGIQLQTTVATEQFHSSKPSVSFALPSVSQWYRLLQPGTAGSIPVSNSSLPTLPVSLITPTSFVATSPSSSASIASIHVPSYVVSGASPVAIPPSSPYSAAHSSMGFGMQLQPSILSSQPRFPMLTLRRDTVGNVMTSCGVQSPAVGIKSETVMKDSHLSTPSIDHLCIWSTGNHTKVQVPLCLESSAAAPPQIVSSSDLLTWQQQQIQILQKQLHLSRLQLLETHRRVLEQREQFQTNVPNSRTSSSVSSAPVVQSSTAHDSNRRPERDAACVHMGFEYGGSLPNIPKQNELTCCDVMQELFEEFGAGCVRLTDGDDAIGSSAQELETHVKPCNELLAEETRECKTEEIDHLANGFLSPGYDNSSHSMLEMCAMEIDVHSGETDVRDSKTDLTSAELEKLDNGSFYLSVPLKEPPKYDDVVKDKQKSSASNSAVAITANSVDDLLQILMKQTDVLGHSTSVSEHLLASESDTSPLTFASPMSHDLAIDEINPQEMDVYPYSAGSNGSSSSGIDTAPSTCGDFLSDPLSASGISSSTFSEIPFQLPDWTDSEFLDLSLLGKIKFDQLDVSKSSCCNAQSTAPGFPPALNHALISGESRAGFNPMPSSNDYDPCLAGFGPAFANCSLGLTDLLDASVSSLPSSDSLNFSRSFDMLDDLFMMEGDDIFEDPCNSISERHLDISNISNA